MKYNETIHELITSLLSDIEKRDQEKCILLEFTSKPEIMNLFEQSLSTSDDEIFKRYQNMAHHQYQNGVAYSQFSHFFDLFKTELINKAAIIVDDTKLIERINVISQIVTNATAKGYLLELINSDIPAINAQLSEYVAIKHINAHLHWIKQIIYDIEHNVSIANVELSPQKCQFGLWLATDEISNFFTPHEVTEFHAMHNSVHNSGKSIYYHLKNGNFHQVLVDYLFLARISINLVSRLNIKITHQLLVKKAETDSLTKLNNRHSLEPILNDSFALYKQDKTIFSLAMLDIDFFKKINDTFGHQTGDEVLIEMAQIVKKNLRSSDIIFRYGGEEFLIIFQSCYLESAVAVCEKLRYIIEQHQFNEPLQNYPVTVSIGITTINENDATPQSIVEKADNNLYKAKEQGRNRIIF